MKYFFLLITLLWSDLSYCQHNNYDFNNSVYFIGEELFVDTDKFVVTYYSSGIQILINMDDISILENDTSFKTAIGKSGYIYLHPCYFYRYFNWPCYFDSLMLGRPDSMAFKSVCYFIMNDCNSEHRNNLLGDTISVTSYNVVEKINHNSFLIGFVKVSFLKKTLGDCNSNFPNIPNGYFRFAIPLRKE